MLGPARHLGQLARSAAGRRRQERDDADALRELEARPLELPAGLELEWLGVSGYRVTFQDHTLYVDPYWKRILPRLDPRVVVPGHYDHFFRPLGDGMDLITNVKPAELPHELAAVSADLTLAALQRLPSSRP